MAGSEYHDLVWESVPDDALPGDLDRRRRFLLEHVRADGVVLDLGCGAGEFSAALERAGARPIAVDVSRHALDRASRRVADLDVRLAAAGDELPLADGEVDGVWAGDVIEHVPDVLGWLSEVRRVLRPGGWLAITTPNLARGPLVLDALRPAGLRARFDPRSDHVRFFTASGLRELLADLGFDAVEVRGVGGAPFWRASLHAVARRGRW